MSLRLWHDAESRFGPFHEELLRQFGEYKDIEFTVSLHSLRFLSVEILILANTFLVVCRRVVSCGVLETPRFGRKLSFNFMPGAKVSFECNEGFVLIGDQRRECLSTGLWNIPEYGYTTCLRKLIYTYILFAIYIPNQVAYQICIVSSGRGISD